MIHLRHKVCVCFFSLLVISTLAFGQGGVPHYCKTSVGVLGPYPNDGSVKVGDACFGTTPDGQRHEGTAVMSKGSSAK